jgi:hypothetical protein
MTTIKIIVIAKAKRIKRGPRSRMVRAFPRELALWLETINSASNIFIAFANTIATDWGCRNDRSFSQKSSELNDPRLTDCGRQWFKSFFVIDDPDLQSSNCGYNSEL